MNDYFDARLMGGRMEEERERLKLSKVALAEACGVRREMIGRYEKGEASPGAEVLAKLMALGADVAFILTGHRIGMTYQPTPSIQAHAINEASAEPELELTQWEKAHIQNLRECEKEDRDAIGRMALRSAEAQLRNGAKEKLKKAG